eukprot:5775512-Pyramimonas_sp.AAC.1
MNRLYFIYPGCTINLQVQVRSYTTILATPCLNGCVQYGDSEDDFQKVTALVVDDDVEDLLEDEDLEDEDTMHNAKADDVEWPAPDRDDFMKVQKKKHAECRVEPNCS